MASLEFLVFLWRAARLRTFIYRSPFCLNNLLNQVNKFLVYISFTDK